MPSETFQPSGDVTKTESTSLSPPAHQLFLASGARLAGASKRRITQRPPFASFAQMKTAFPSDGQIAFLAEEGREGHFVYCTGDYSAEVAADPMSGVYVATDGDPAGTNGTWIRKHGREVRSKWFGAKHDGVTDDSAALRAWATAASSSPNLIARLDAGETRYSTANGPLLFCASLTRITGDGKIKSIDAFSSLVSIQGNYCKIDKISLEGDGTYSDSATSEVNRYALVDISGDYCDIVGAKMYEAHQIFIRFYLTTGGSVSDCEFHGGIPRMKGTGYHGIRGYSATGFTVERNEFFSNSSGGKIEEVIIPVVFSDPSDNIIIRRNTVHDCFDHCVYAIGTSNIMIVENVFTSKGSGIAVSSPDSTVSREDRAIIRHNTCKANADVDPANDRTVGLYLRDANFQTCSNNTVIGFPTGIQLAPVQYGKPSNVLCDNSICNNKIVGCTLYGIAIGTSSRHAAQISRNNIENNSITFDSKITRPESRGISLVAGNNENGFDIMNKNIVKYNIIIGGSYGIAAQDNSDLTIDNNKLFNQNISGISGVRLTNALINENYIYGTPKFGIEGGNNSIGCKITSNTILGAIVAAIRQFQQSRHGNVTSGNKIGGPP